MAWFQFGRLDITHLLFVGLAYLHSPLDSRNFLTLAKFKSGNLFPIFIDLMGVLELGISFSCTVVVVNVMHPPEKRNPELPFGC